jgi:lantibiotic modifying enzyme
MGGWGGALYALSVSAPLLGRAELARAAGAALREVDPARLRADSHFHVVAGSAGALLALLALHRAGAGGEALRLAGVCGAHLLARRTVHPASGLRAWRAPDGVFRTGFGKGAAGIAHALLELHRETGRGDLLDGAAEALGFVRAHRHECGTSWALGSPEIPTAGTSLAQTWCLGGAGIGLASAAALDLLPGAEIRGECEVALRSTVASGRLAPLDTCCCGNAAHLELLLTLARGAGRPELLHHAHRLGGEMLERAGRRGTFNTAQSKTYAPGFFKGLAGIGYQLLRLHHPGQLPPVLLMGSNASAPSTP